MSLTLPLLDDLIGFDTVSVNSNLPLLDMVQARLTAAGITCWRVMDETGQKANLFATTGPAGDGGVLLSAHVDVVPVAGQDWRRPAFKLTEEAGRLYGRGTTDMKGFVACAVNAMLDAARRPLAQPLHLALSHDEEVGCKGVPSLIAELARRGPRPALCIVGEPTELQVATGHKGKIGIRSRFTGRAGHSARAPMAVNALWPAAAMVAEIRAIQKRMETEGARDPDYTVPYSTLHVGRLAGGGALNMVPEAAEMDWEIRYLPEDDGPAAVTALKDRAAALVAAMGDPDATVSHSELMNYPGLGTAADAPVVRLVQRLAGTQGTLKVDYGTEGGLFANDLGLPTVVCGPGSMAQGHIADEFIARSELERCDAMLARLIDRLEAGEIAL